MLRQHVAVALAWGLWPWPWLGVCGLGLDTCGFVNITGVHSVIIFLSLSVSISYASSRPMDGAEGICFRPVCPCVRAAGG